MKKFVAIFLLLQFLTSNSFAEEFIKLPKLFTHYYHHSHEHHDTTDFIDYLSRHYNNHEQDTHHEEDEDCNLPFKHCNNCCINAHTPVLAFVPSFGESDVVFAIAVTVNYLFENEKIKNICSPSIWQPPKSA